MHWRLRRRRSAAPAATVAASSASIAGTASPAGAGAPAARPKKLSYKEQRELDALPAQIEALEIEQKDLAALLGSADFYAGDPVRVEAAQMRCAQIDDELLQALERWEALGTR